MTAAHAAHHLEEDHRMSDTAAGPGCSCGKPTGDNAYLCRECTAQLVANLRELGPAATEVPVNALWLRDYDQGGLQVRDDEGRLIPVGFGRSTSTRWDTPVGSRGGLADHLEVTLTRQSRIGDQNGRRGGDKPVPFNQRAGEIRGQLDQHLRPWALWLAGQLPPVRTPGCRNPRHDDPGVCCIACRHLERAAAHLTRARRAEAVQQLTGAPVAGVVAFLVRHVDAIPHDAGAGQLKLAVADAVATIRKIIDRPGKQRYGGACGAELTTGAVCTTALYAEEGDREFECRACGTRWKVEERQAWLRDLTVDELATAPLIASALSTPDDKLEVKRIHQWVHRGQLIPRGHLPAQACNAHRSQHTAPVPGCEDCAKKKGQPLIRVGDVQVLLNQHAERLAKRQQRRERKAPA